MKYTPGHRVRARPCNQGARTFSRWRAEIRKTKQTKNSLVQMNTQRSRLCFNRAELPDNLIWPVNYDSILKCNLKLTQYNFDAVTTQSRREAGPFGNAGPRAAMFLPLTHCVTISSEPTSRRRYSSARCRFGHDRRDCRENRQNTLR